MLAAVIIVLVSVAAGAALAVVPGVHGRAIGAVRTFALLAAFGVVAFHLLPHALEGVGLGALVALGGGLLVPPALQRVVTTAYLRAHRTSRVCLGLEAGYFGLIAHQVGDGLALGAASGRGLVLLMAIAAHTVPVVAVVVLAFAAEYGIVSALLRAAGLAAGSLFGILLIVLVDGAWLAAATPWVDAAVAGLLLHFVAHGLTEDLPQTSFQRAGDLASGAIGIALSVMPGMVHDDTGRGGGHDDHGEVLAALFALAGRMAPGLILGVLVAVGIVAARGPIQRLVGSLPRGVARGLLAAALDPIAGWRMSREGLPEAAGAGPGAATAGERAAFFAAASGMAPEAFVLTLTLFGAAFAIWRLILLALVAVAVSLPIALWALKERPRGGGSGSAPAPDAAERPRLIAAVAEFLARMGPWLVIGHLVGAYVHALSPNGATASIPDGSLGAAVVVAVCFLVHLHPTAVVPPLLGFASAGVGPELSMLVLVLAPVPWVAMARRVARDQGQVVAAFALLAGVAVAIGGASALAPFVTITPLYPPTANVEPAGAALGWVLLAGVLLLVGAWPAGIRGWIAVVVHPHRHERALAP